MRSRRMLGRLAAGAALALSTLFLVPSASAAVTCSFAAGTVSIDFGAAGESVTVVRSGSAINVNGAACGVATVTNTDLIDIDGNGLAGTQTVTIDLSGGRFEPGATVEGAGTSEIEIDVHTLGNDPSDTLTIVGSSATTPLATSGDDTITLEDGAGPPEGEANFNEAAGALGEDFDDLTWNTVASVIVNSGAGTDTVDASGYTADAVNVNGGDGDDWILGTTLNDVLAGGNGSDTVDYSGAPTAVLVNLLGTQSATGGGGTDTISTFENIVGSAFNDILTGDVADNWITPGLGNDVAFGNDGSDTLDYSDAPAGVTVDLALSTQNTGGSGTDTISGMENINGSAFSDTLIGDAADNVLGDGGGLVNDTLTGGDGNDVADYSAATVALTVNLTTATAQATGQGSDTITGIEGVWGGTAADTFTGTSGDNDFDGGAGSDTVTWAAATAGVVIDLTGGTATGDGADTLTSIENATGGAFNDTIGGTSGNNTLDGAGGVDTVDYSGAAAGVSVSLALQPAAQVTGGAGTDTLIGFENIGGSALGDSLTGDGFNNVIVGGAGDDQINGGVGVDTADYSGSSAAVVVDLTFGTATGGDGVDTLSGMENVTGSAFDDTIGGDAANNRLDGGDGVDTVTFKFSATSVRVDLRNGIAIGAGADLLSNFENITGSDLGDDIAGSDGDNVIKGAAGNDKIGGKGGNDTLNGNSGNDKIGGAAGDDALRGGAGADDLNGGPGDDSCVGGPGSDSTRACE